MATLTDAEYARLVQDVKAQLLADARPVTALPQADSLDGVTSMPAVRTTAGTEQAVQVPISLLQQPALNAAQKAIDAAGRVETVLTDAGRLPVVRDGNWWTWDTETRQYADTGIRAERTGEYDEQTRTLTLY